MHSVGLISNPRSRRNRRDPAIVDRLKEILSPLAGRAWMESTPDLEGLPELARRWREAGVTTLALNGGDGTNHHTLSRMLPAWGGPPWPEVLLLRGGTMNTAANGLRVPRGSPTELLGAWVRDEEAGRTPPSVERRLLAVDADERPQLLGFMFGNGLLAGFLEVYYEDPEPGPATAAWTLARVIGAAVTGGRLSERVFAPVDVAVTVDGRPWETRSRMALAVATVPQIGLGFSPWYRSEEIDSFHAIGFGCPPLTLVGHLPTLYRGRPTGDRRIEDESGRELQMVSDRPHGFILDGDYHPPACRVRVTLGPRLRFPLPDPRVT